MIALFSPNGNGRLVAEALSPLLGGEAIVPLLTLDNDTAGREERIVWVFPIHAWSAPEVVERTISGLSFAPATEHYMVATCGDDIGRADRRFRRLIESRGGKVTGCFSVLMPNTYVNLPGFDTDSPAVAYAKLLAASRRVAFIAKAIRHRMVITDVCPGGLPGLKSGFLRWFFRRFLMSAKPFHCEPDKCVGCGACARVCPLGNITMDASGRPRWGADCATCMACYHACRTHAVAYGGRTRSKGQYHAPDSIPVSRRNSGDGGRSRPECP